MGNPDSPAAYTLISRSSALARAAMVSTCVWPRATTEGGSGPLPGSTPRGTDLVSPLPSQR